MRNTERDKIRARNAMHRRDVLGLVTTAAGAMTLGARGLRAQSDGDLNSLTKAAKQEGEIVLYSSATDNVIHRVAEAFDTKYGVKVGFLRLGSAPLLQRYSSEAQAGSFAADLIFVGGGASNFVETALPKSWIETPDKLPVVTSGEYPSKYVGDGVALIQIAPWTIPYNSDKVKGDDIPKTWTDLLNPKFKGQILTPDLNSTDALVQLWAALETKYGKSFVEGIKAENPRWFPNAVPAIQALGAGEGMALISITPQGVAGVADKGAPVGMVIPDYTTGVEMQLILTARDKAKHPNAARLFANFVMSTEGNLLFNADKGSISIYDTTHMPKDYVSPKPQWVKRKDDLIKMLRDS